MARRLDIPLNRDGAVRFLPWLIAVMVYLAALALAGLLVLGGTLAHWDRSLSATLTVELPPAADPAAGDGKVAAVLGVLRLTPGVVSAEPMSRTAIAKLIEPWLGGLPPDELALPRLIDLRIDPARPPDLDALRRRLATAAPAAMVDDHRLWLDRFASLIRSIQLVAGIVVALIGAAAMLTVVFTTRAGLAVHQGVIEVLHHIGARDGYIAAQFESQALRLTLRGGLIGLGAAAATLLALASSAAAAAALGGDTRLLPALDLAPWHWLMLALLPLGAALLAMITTRITVLRALARLP